MDTVATLDNEEEMEMSKSCHGLLSRGRTNSLSGQFHDKMAAKRIGRRKVKMKRRRG